MEEIMRFDRNADGVVSGFLALGTPHPAVHTPFSALPWA